MRGGGQSCLCPATRQHCPAAFFTGPVPSCLCLPVPGQVDALSCPSISTPLLEGLSHPPHPPKHQKEVPAAGTWVFLALPCYSPFPLRPQFTHLYPDVLDFQTCKARMVSCRWKYLFGACPPLGPVQIFLVLPAVPLGRPAGQMTDGSQGLMGSLGAMGPLRIQLAPCIDLSG